MKIHFKMAIILSVISATFFPGPAMSASSPVCSGSWCRTDIDRTNDYLMIRDHSGSGVDNRLWIENNTGAIVAELRMEDTNPAHYAAVYAALKDGLVTGSFTFLRVYYVSNFGGASGIYKKIAQVGIR